MKILCYSCEKNTNRNNNTNNSDNIQTRSAYVSQLFNFVREMKLVGVLKNWCDI